MSDQKTETGVVGLFYSLLAELENKAKTAKPDAKRNWESAIRNLKLSQARAEKATNLKT